MRPNIVVSGLADISANMRGRVEDRLKDFVAAKIEGLLGPLVTLQAAANSEGENALQGLTKGVAYRLVENFGATSRTQFGDDLKKIDQNERGKLRRLGMRFGEYTLFMPALLKPAPSRLLILLWALWTDRPLRDTAAPKAGLVSLEMNEHLPHAYYYAAGYRPSGNRAVRIDMLERLAGLIRTARNEANMREGFEATSQMMSLVGCSGEDFEAIMRSLGLRKTMVKRKIEKPAATKSASMAPGSDEQKAPPQAQDAETPKPEEARPAAIETSEPAPTVPATESVATPEPAVVLEPVKPEPEKSEPVANAAATPDQKSAESPSAPIASEPPHEEIASTTPEAASIEGETPAPAAAEDPAPEEIEVALWKPAPRKVFTKPKRDAKPARKHDGKQDGNPDARRKGKKPPTGKFQERGRRPKDNGPMHEPRHRKVADPNSPFAVLAGLKSQLADAPAPQKAKKPEKAE